jgi:hypothetical protein
MICLFQQQKKQRVLSYKKSFKSRSIDQADSPHKKMSMEEITMAAASLGDDVLLEILFCIRNDPATLFRCATACKRWRRLIADPSFLRRC